MTQTATQKPTAQPRNVSKEMQTQTDNENKAKKAAAQAESAKLAKKAPAVIPHVNDRALSVDVGPRVLGTMFDAQKTEAKVAALEDAVNKSKYKALSDLTAAILKAARADQSIDLTAAFSPDTKRVEQLNTQLRIALGISIVVKDEKGAERVSVSPAAAKFFPSKADKVGTEAYVRKNTLRSNFSHQLKLCAQAAQGIIDMNAEARYDEKAGTLRLSGPGVKAQFGTEQVLLNEQKATVGTGEEAKTLKVKPSFTEVKRIAEAKRGGPAKTATNPGNKADSGPKLPDVSTDAAFGTLCNTLIAAINRMTGSPNEAQAKAMRSVQSAIAAKLGG